MTPRAPQVSRHTLKDGTQLRVLCWPHDKPTKDVLLIQHGIGEHAGRYQTWADALADVPVTIWSFDSRGCGDSQGLKGHADRGLQTLADDLEQMIQHVKATSGCTQMFVAGHSLGGAVLGQYAVSRAPDPIIKGLLFSAPAMRIPRNPVISIKLALGGIIGGVIPKLTLPTGLDVHGISSDPAEVQRYIKDPLVHDKCSAALGVSIQRDGEALPDQAKKVTLPCVIWNGDKDPIVDHVGTRAWVKNLGTTDVKYLEIRGAMHETHHEVPALRAVMFDLVKGWLTPRLSA